MSKYPAFTRVGSGKLRAGDSILVREGFQDPLPLELELEERVPRWHADAPRVPAGVHVVQSVKYEREPGYRRARTHYLVTVRDSAGVDRTFKAAPVQRINLVTP